MDVCFFTYNEHENSLPNIFAHGVMSKPEYSDKVKIVNYDKLNHGLIKSLIKKHDLIAIQGTWGSEHWSRLGNEPAGKMNSINQVIKYLSCVTKKPLLVFESPTLSRVRSTVQTLKDFHPRYYRISLDHWLYGVGEFFDKDHDHTRFERFCKANRLLKTKSEMTWASRSSNSPILVLPEKNSAPRSHGISPMLWSQTVIEILTRSTNRPILIKASPHHYEDIDYQKYQSSRVTVLNKNINLHDVLDESWASVILDSTACFESVWQGVPVFCYPGSFASGLGNTDITLVDMPKKPNPLPWWQKMAFTEFTQQEIQRGTAWSFIRPYILDKISRTKK
jgi:hypothetical protein